MRSALLESFLPSAEKSSAPMADDEWPAVLLDALDEAARLWRGSAHWRCPGAFPPLRTAHGHKRPRPDGVGDGSDSILICNNAHLLADEPQGILRLFEYSLPDLSTQTEPRLLRTVEMHGFDDLEGLALIASTATSYEIVVSEEERLGEALGNLVTLLYSRGQRH